MKWFLDKDNVFYPTQDETVFYEKLKPGVYQLIATKQLSGTKLGLRYLFDKFTFNFKLYDLGYNNFIKKVLYTWNSNIYKKSGKNLSIILNGLRGTSKTVCGKIIANCLNLPIITITERIEEAAEFIKGLDFECVVFIDEAEKIYGVNSGDEEDLTLLKICDGLDNSSRKFIIMTMNELAINKNLLSRPGRVRYLKEFSSLRSEIVIDYIKDNLNNPLNLKKVVKIINNLDFVTIDIVKSIIEEFNILNEVSSSSSIDLSHFKDMNIEFKPTTYLVLHVSDKDVKNFLKEILVNKKETENTLEFLKRSSTKDYENEIFKFFPDSKDCDDLGYINREGETVFYNLKDYLQNIRSFYLTRLKVYDDSLLKGCETENGTIFSAIDEFKFFTIKDHGGEFCDYLYVEKESLQDYNLIDKIY